MGFPNQEAVVYSHGVVTVLPTPPGYALSSGLAINDAGEVAGTFYSDLLVNQPIHTFLYSGGVMRDLGTLPGDWWSAPFGINNSGEVVGWSYDYSGRDRAFLYSGGVMRDLGTLGGPRAAAFAINDAGDVVGGSDTPAGGHAFLYSKGIMHDLGALQPGGYSSARAINAKGQIVGVSVAHVGDFLHAFVYENGTMTDLGAPVNQDTEPYCINNRGQIVGDWIGVDRISHAFVYTPTSGFIDLNSILPSNSGWQLMYAEAINDAGQIIGQGNFPGRGFISFMMTIEISDSPVTTAAISGSGGSNGWYLGAVSVALSATSRGSSVAATYFSVDGAAYQLYAGPFSISGDGTHQLSYYSVDIAGAQETAARQTVRIDSGKPVSHVPALPATALAPNFSVSWSGSDATSGIATYTIFVADNGGAFAPWISGTTATQATYAGAVGHTYGFYSIATDMAGNQELAKTSAETMTTVPTRPVSHVLPLPANAPAANFAVQWSGTAPGVGIRNYTIYASDNGGAFAPWLSATTATQGTYSGVCEHNYGFYSIATDNHGLQEVAKTAAEATTRVPFNPVSHVLALPGIAPSPNFNVQWAGVNTCTPIQTWAIYVSDNGGAFAMWKARTSSTQAYFSGVLGHTYGF